MTSNATEGCQPLIRLTVPVVIVLRALARSERLYGLQLVRETGLRTGTVYVILPRLERAGWVTSSWEDKDEPGAVADMGPRRKYYQLTAGGREMALAALKLREHLFA